MLLWWWQIFNSERFIESTCVQQDFDSTTVTKMLHTKSSNSESFTHELIVGFINIFRMNMTEINLFVKWNCQNQVTVSYFDQLSESTKPLFLRHQCPAEIYWWCSRLAGRPTRGICGGWRARGSTLL